MPLVINGLGADAQTYTHTVQMSTTKQFYVRNQALAATGQHAPGLKMHFKLEATYITNHFT